MLTININPECDACLFNKIHTPATTKSTHPDFHGWELCESCAQELNKRKPTYPIEGWEPPLEQPQQ
jgi:hypothetical protein